MSQKDREKQLRKKRKEFAKRKARLVSEPLQPYTGAKYRNEASALLHFALESGIYRAYVDDRQLVDVEVRRAVERLGHQLRRALVEPCAAPGDKPTTADRIELVVWHMRDALREYGKESPCPGRDNTVGVLRSILGSMETYASSRPQSRNYLEFVGEFLARIRGTSMAYDVGEIVSRYARPGLEAETDVDPDEDSVEDETADDVRPRLE